MHYIRGPVAGLAVAELISEVNAEGRRVAVSLLSLAQALADPGADDPTRQAQLQWFLTEDTETTVVPMSTVDAAAVSRLARVFSIDLPLAHSIHLAAAHDAPFATATPKLIRHILGEDWSVLDIAEPPFGAPGEPGGTTPAR